MTESHKHDHPHPHRKPNHHHHPHGPHAHEKDPNGHHHLIGIKEPPPPPVPQPVTAPAPTMTVTPQENLRTVIQSVSPGEVILVEDAEFTHHLTQKIVPPENTRIILEASISGDDIVDMAFDVRTSKKLGFGIFGSPTTPGKITNFVEQSAKLWIDSVLSNFGIEDIKGTGTGAGFEGERNTPVLCEFLRIRRCGHEETTGHDAGGIKFARTGDIAGPTVRYCDIEDCEGNGIWADVQSCSMQVIKNHIAGVGRKGILWEKSGASDELGPYREGTLICDGNDVHDWGREGRQSSDSGYSVMTSKNAHFMRNLADGTHRYDFEAETQTNRLEGEKHGWRLENIVVDATNTFPRLKKGCNDPGVFCGV